VTYPDWEIRLWDIVWYRCIRDLVLNRWDDSAVSGFPCTAPLLPSSPHVEHNDRISVTDTTQVHTANGTFRSIYRWWKNTWENFFNVWQGWHWFTRVCVFYRTGPFERRGTAVSVALQQVKTTMAKRRLTVAPVFQKWPFGALSPDFLKSFFFFLQNKWHT